MIECVSKEIGALSDLVEDNEDKGRVGQVCDSVFVSVSSCRSLSLSLSVGLCVSLSVGLSILLCKTDRRTGGLAGKAPIDRDIRIGRSLSRSCQIVGANKFRTASAEIADKIRRLVEVLQSGLQVLRTRQRAARASCRAAHARHCSWRR
jgi:hypothetical protein